MRKLLLCVPMIILLSGCFGMATVGNQTEELTLAVRADYLALRVWAADVALTADYGQRVYQYRLAATQSGEELVLALSEPETVAGIIARLKDGDSMLEYDDLWLETGPLNPDGLTPVACIPALIEAAKSGYIVACSLEDGLLRLDCGDPEGLPGAGIETTLWFDVDSYAMVRGEISVDGFRAILCEFSNFTKG